MTCSSPVFFTPAVGVEVWFCGISLIRSWTRESLSPSLFFGVWQIVDVFVQEARNGQTAERRAWAQSWLLMARKTQVRGALPAGAEPAGSSLEDTHDREEQQQQEMAEATGRFSCITAHQSV